MPTVYVPFTTSLIPAASILLAQRHSADRSALPILPVRFEDPAVASQSIESVLNRKGARGLAAMDGDRLIAYMIGDTVLDSEMWGRSGWVRLPGCAYETGCDVGVVCELYARLAEQWVTEGCFYHLVFIPAMNEQLVKSWFSLSFGIEQIYGLMDLGNRSPVPHTKIPNITIRKALTSDRGLLTKMSGVIWQTQIMAPVWGSMMPEVTRGMKEDWGNMVDDKAVVLWLALENERIVALQAYWPGDESFDNMYIPEKSINLCVAGTSQGDRGRGIGTLLTEHALDDALANGYRYCDTDWRSTNLLSSRFWPKKGFLSATYRLTRRIDQRISWAIGD